MSILDTIKSWWYRLFNREALLVPLGLDIGSLEYNALLDYVQIWKRIYSGTEFEDIKDPKIAASVCHEAARLVVAEMEVALGDSPRAKYIQNIIQRQIIDRAGEITEYVCALDGVFFKPRFDGSTIITDMITQDSFFPTNYSNEGITGGIFVDCRRRGKYMYTRLENYAYKGKNTYMVENRAFRAELNSNDLGRPVPLADVPDWENIEPAVTITGASVPIFAYYRMPGANYIEPGNPMGVSLIGKAVDSIKAATTAYNALDWEVEGSELKRYRDISTFTNFDDKGNPIPDRKRQKEYYYNGAAGGAGEKIQLFETFSPELRVTDQIAALNRHLHQIETQTGFSQGTFSVDAATGQATATEVVADKQKTYSTVHDIQTKAFEPALRQLIAIYDFYCTVYNLAPKGEIKPSFSWDDSVISSPDARRARIQMLVTQGKFPLWRYLNEYEGYDELTAKNIAAETEGTGDMISFEDDDTQTAGDVSSVGKDVKDSVGVTLNGAQVASLIGVVKSVKAGEISKASAIALIVSSFGMTEDQANKLLAEDIVQPGV